MGFGYRVNQLAFLHRNTKWLHTSLSRKNLDNLPPFPTHSLLRSPSFLPFPMKTFISPPAFLPFLWQVYPHNTHLTPVLMKDNSHSFLNCLHLSFLYFLDSLTFTFVIYWIGPAQNYLVSFSSYLAAIFWEQFFWRNRLTEEGAFTQCGAKIMILYVQEQTK